MTEPMTITPTRTPLGEAVTLYTLQTRRFKTARLTLSFTFPADEQGAMENTLLFGVLRRGTEAYPGLSAINRRLDELYGTTLTVRNYLHGDRQVLGLTAEFLEQDFLAISDRGHMDLLAHVAEVMAQLLLHPLTDPDGCLRRRAVAQEKEFLCDTLRAERNDPRGYAVNRLRHFMCAGEPYGIHLGGTVEGVSAITPEALTSRWRAWMRRAACTVFYVGRTSHDQVAAAWQTAFDGWHPILVPTPPTIPHPCPAAPRAVEESLPVGQGRLCMGWASGVVACPSPTDGCPDDYAAMLILCELMGGMQDAMLFRYVREELGLCYECESSYDPSKGILTATCGIRSDRRDETEAAIRHVWENLKTGRLTDEDVTAAILSMTSGYHQMPDAPASLEAYWFGGVLAGVDEPPATMLARLSRVSTADVVRVANRLTLDTVYFLQGTRLDEYDEGEEDDL